MSDDRTGTLGSVNIRLPHFVDGEERYRRTYKPVTPASRIVTGADDAIAPETDIASWEITDWSGGEGDVRWRDRGRYNTGTGVTPVAAGAGLVLGMSWSETSAQAGAISKAARYMARDMDDYVYYWNGSTFTTYGTGIGGSASRDAIAIEYVHGGGGVYVLDEGGYLRKDTGAANFAWDSNTDLIDIALFDGKLYGIADNDLYEIDTTTASTRTKVAEVASTYPSGPSASIAAQRAHWLSASDVGPIWISAESAWDYSIREYNAYTDTPSRLGSLPIGVWPTDIGFHSGIHFVAYRSAGLGVAGTGYIWYQTSTGQQGTLGPLPGDDTTEPISLMGTIGSRLFYSHDQGVWAYDLTDGAFIKIADLSTATPSEFRQGILRDNRDLVLMGDTYYVEIEPDAYQANEAQTLSTGRDDYGYPGLPKLLHTVTATTEDTLAAAHTVEVGYSVDGGSTTWLSDDFATGEGAHTWAVSSNASSVIGTEVEWHLRLTSTSSSSSPKVVGLYSDASGAKSRIEWAVAVDVDRSSTVEGEDVISALNGLKTSHAVVQWSDPFQVGPYDSAETFDVRVLDVSTPEYAEGEGLIALVKFQTIGVVG